MLQVLDSVAWTADTAFAGDLSYGRYPDGSETWSLFGGENPHPVTPGTSNNPVSIEDEQIPAAELKLCAYPNPSHGSLNIELKNAKTPYKIQVYNLKGQLVKEYTSETKGKTVWDGLDRNGNKLASGIYYLNVSSAGKKFIQKICIIQ